LSKRPNKVLRGIYKVVREKTTPVFLTEVNSYNALNKACNEKNGSIIGEGISVGEGPRSNMAT
jgi:hypothetical protein